jgi:hypothetical protein
MRRLLLLAFLAAAPAAAQDRLVIRRDVCDQLANLSPSADVEYRRGVDARGRPVAPADLSPESNPRVDEIVIEIDADMRRRFGLSPARRFFAGEVNVGVVVIQDNKAFFNGQPLEDREQAMLAQFCSDGSRPPRALTR